MLGAAPFQLARGHAGRVLARFNAGQKAGVPYLFIYLFIPLGRDTTGLDHVMCAANQPYPQERVTCTQWHTVRKCTDLYT
jgi:hypothetical protein